MLHLFNQRAINTSYLKQRKTSHFHIQSKTLLNRSLGSTIDNSTIRQRSLSRAKGGLDSLTHTFSHFTKTNSSKKDLSS